MKVKSKKLFDFATCRCTSRLNCKCPRDKKVPHADYGFLKDQRTKRELSFIAKILSCPDFKQNSSLASSSSSWSHSVECTSSASSDESEVACKRKVSSDDEDLSIKKSCQNRMILKKVPIVADRYRISSNAAALIATAALEDIGVINEGNSSCIIDRSKIRRSRNATREIQLAALNNNKDLYALFFDGRIDKTKTYIDNKIRVTKEDHISLVREPGSFYMGHVTVPSGHAKIIVQNIIEYFNTNSILFNQILAIGSDGEKTNTGCRGGVIKLLEEHVQRPLQWLICFLHTNELPLRALVKALDGPTTGPRGFSGPIGKELFSCEKKRITNFQKIDFSCFIEDIPGFGTSITADQLYLYDMCKAISNGHIPEKLANRLIGLISHARWLTLASRILRLYVATENPSENLNLLANYIVKVYATTHFNVKSDPSCCKGAVYLFKAIKATITFPEKVKTILQKSFAINCWYSHPENILLAMVDDDNESIRELGWRRILKARSQNNTQNGIRLFALPNIIFENFERYFVAFIKNKF